MNLNRDTEQPLLLSASQASPAGYRRYVVLILCSLGLMLVYMMRVDLSVAVLPMTSQYRWSGNTEAFVLSSFYIGYIFGQIPGGSIATRFGGHIVLGVGVLATGVFTMLLPLATCGTLECRAYTASDISISGSGGGSGGGGLNITNATCGYSPSNRLATLSSSNLTFDDCYAACLGTCFQHGNESNVCATNAKFQTQRCIGNCTPDSYCSVFAFSNGSSSSSFSFSQATCVLYHACQPTPATTTTTTTITADGQQQHPTLAAPLSLFDIQATSYLGSLFTLRILMGLFESVTLPAFFALLAHWTPSSERSFNVGLGAGGAYIGTALAFPVCSTLVTSSIPVIGRWPGMFYLFGMLTLVWAVAWFAIVRKRPEDDPHVSLPELSWIVTTRRSDDAASSSAAARKHDSEGGSSSSGGGGAAAATAATAAAAATAAGEALTVFQKCRASVWTKLLLCPAAWALFAAHFATNWISYTLLVGRWVR
jgi:MFS family permease